MTETSILPVTSDEGQPPSYDSQPPEDGGAAGANRRKLYIAGGVAGAAVVAVAAFMLLHGGSSGSPAAAVVVPHGTPAASAPAAKAHSGSGAKVTTLPGKAKVQAGRNPFIPLYVAPSAATGTAVGATTTVSTAPTPIPTTTSPAAPVSQPSTPPTTPPATGLGSPIYLQLLATNGAKSATFKVGYAHHKFKKYLVVAPTGSSTTGTVFDSEFSLVGVQDGQATVQIGDGTPFDLSKGVVRRV